MAELDGLEALQALHRDLVSVCEHRLENVQSLEQSLHAHVEAFKNLLDQPGREGASRSAVQSGKIKIGDEDYEINESFRETALMLADELLLNEIEAAKLLLESEGDQAILGRPLLECGVIRFHQKRKYLLDCMRLCIEITSDDDLAPEFLDPFGAFVAEHVFGEAPGNPTKNANQRIVPRCLAAMQEIKAWLQRIADKIASQNAVYQAQLSGDMQETIEFSRVSLVQQHELLAVIMCSAIEKRYSEVQNFRDFLKVLKKLDRYDHLLVHLFPALGAYIAVYGSTEGLGDVIQARELNKLVCSHTEDDSWSLLYLSAAVRAWWIAEYSGFYLDAPADLIPGTDLDDEDRQRSKQFLEALKDGAFDFILSVAADCKTADWQDPTRSGIRQWLQRKSPLLATDSFLFAEFFQTSLMTQLEVLIDAFISNLPDVLRKLRTEEDEQRQLSQLHEQDVDLERFLLIIAYAYEGRPEAADAFWSDPDSNLAGFLQWASRRASTPLVSAFCEMLQALSDNEDNATAAHQFLLDEGQPSSGKMRRSHSLTWGQIFKELLFFTNKIRERPSPAQTHGFRAGKPSTEQAETEPESAMMLECYLRLITKLSSESEEARHKLLRDPDFNLVEVLYQLASSMIPPRLRACVFYALQALLSRKTQDEGHIMWKCVDSWITGGYAVQPRRDAHGAPVQSSTALMEAIFEEIGNGFEEPNAFIQFLSALVAPVGGYSALNDTLPFPEDLGSSVRMPGIELYVDFVLGHVFSYRSKDVGDTTQLRMLRLSCLEFALICLSTFNENLIILGNESNIAIDSAISATDLATYVSRHPFARVMEWMFNDKVIDALFATIHQEAVEVGNASPDSPLLLCILRAVETMIKVLELQATYSDLVLPLIKTQLGQRRRPVPNSAYDSFEDGIMSHLQLVVDLGSYCGIGHPPLTLACLKLLEKISSSQSIAAAWNTDFGGRQSQRNKAIVILEKNGADESIAASLAAELTTPLDPTLGPEAPNYLIKCFILDFLYECLKTTPDRPTIAHLLLGFRCELNALAIEPKGPFDERTSLFHSLLGVLIGVPFGDETGMRKWLIGLNYKILRIMQILCTSPLSSALVLNELRTNQFLFHLLLREPTLDPHLAWEGFEIGAREFLFSDGASTAYVDFLAMRAMTFEYTSKELCSVTQVRDPTLKRRIFDALNGQIKEDTEVLTIPTVFDFFDFLSLDASWDISPPEFSYYKDLDLKACIIQEPAYGNHYDIDRVKEVLLLKRNESRGSGQLIPQAELSAIEKEEATLLEYLTFLNNRERITAHRSQLLSAWANLLLVMIESNDFKGTAKISFLLQALQAILPSLEALSSSGSDGAFELAKLAKVLLFKLDFPSVEVTAKENGGASVNGKEGRQMSNLVSDKLFQLFQVCLSAVPKCSGPSELRATYYSVCYRYLTGIADGTGEGKDTASGRRKAVNSIHLYGERLLGVVTDDAFGGNTVCQTAALVFLGGLVSLESGGNDHAGSDTAVVDALSRLNFIGVLVDSLKTIHQDLLAILRANDADAELCLRAKLALLLKLCQTAHGAKHVVTANLFRAIEASGLFTADPDLQIEPGQTRALEKYYSILVAAARVVSAAVLSRGSHNVPQGRRFLTQYRLLLAQTIKRSVGIDTVASPPRAGAGGRGLGSGSESVRLGAFVGAGGLQADESRALLEERIEELAEAFMVLIAATGFVEYEDEQTPATLEKKRPTPALFH